MLSGACGLGCYTCKHVLFPQPFLRISVASSACAFTAMAFEGNASGSGGFDPPGRYFVQRAAAASEPGPEPTPSLLPEDSDDDSFSDHGNRALTDPPPAASGPGFVMASDSYVPSLPSPGPSPGSWATVGDMSTGSEMVDQLSRLRPDTRDRIVQLCTRMSSPPLPKAPKSSFPPARPASAVPKADAPRVQTDDLGFPLALFRIRRSPQPWLKLRRSALPVPPWFTRRRALYSARRRVASTNAAVRCMGAGTATIFAVFVIVFIADSDPFSVRAQGEKRSVCAASSVA